MRHMSIIVIIAFIIVVWAIIVERLSLTIEKDKDWMGLLPADLEMNTSNDFGRHGQCSGGMSIYDTTCGQTAEIKIALDVASRTESQCPNGAGSHAVVVWFMRLHIVTKTVRAMVPK